MQNSKSFASSPKGVVTKFACSMSRDILVPIKTYPTGQIDMGKPVNATELGFKACILEYDTEVLKLDVLPSSTSEWHSSVHCSPFFHQGCTEHQYKLQICRKKCLCILKPCHSCHSPHVRPDTASFFGSKAHVAMELGSCCEIQAEVPESQHILRHHDFDLSICPEAPIPVSALRPANPSIPEISESLVC